MVEIDGVLRRAARMGLFLLPDEMTAPTRARLTGRVLRWDPQLSLAERAAAITPLLDALEAAIRLAPRA